MYAPQFEPGYCALMVHLNPPILRSDPTSPDGFRLWCTFEAACVDRLKLPVLIAGHELSRRQKALVRFGSFATSTGCMGGDGVTDRLCQFNLNVYVAMVLGFTPYALGLPRCWEPCQLEASSGERTVADELRGHSTLAIFTVMLALGWLAVRSQGFLAHEVRLAKNAALVTRIMLGRPTKRSGAMKMLKRLPWLLTHDRRDVMVIQQLFASISPDDKLSRATANALAFSAYAAAACAPAPGDGANPRALAIGEWLRERDVAMNGDAGPTSTRNSIQAASIISLPMIELHQLGWRPLRGYPSAAL